MTTTIKSFGEKWLSKVLAKNNMNDLPDNCMLNKVLTGCGGTTVALTNDIPYVIAVPFRSMIENKLDWAKQNNINICPVMGGISDYEIANYTGNKYIVTYDSLGRLNNFINTSKYKILIDESHKLIDSGSFRGNAIRTVLSNYKGYRAFVFMTATPVKDKYQLPELVDIPKINIGWENVEPVSINYQVVTKDLDKLIAVLGAKHLTNSITTNAHIFINSVTSIIDIISILKKNYKGIQESINIVCADNELNENKITKSLGKKFTISKVGNVNRINFYTSTAFEGSDIFDKDGVTYIVTDGKKDHTKNDILTTLPQIIGRIRNTKYKNQVNLLFTPSLYYSYTTEEEFEENVKKNLDEAKHTVALYNSIDIEMAKIALIKGVETNPYILQEDNTIIINETAWHNEMHNFQALHTTYFVFSNEDTKAKQVLTHNSITYNYDGVDILSTEGYDKLLIGSKANFQTLCEQYIENIDNTDITEVIDINEPMIKEAYDKLGADKMKALGYRRNNIKAELIKIDNIIAKDIKIVMLLGLRVGQFISAKSAKENIQNAYDTLGIKAKAKGTDLSNWYEVKTHTIRDKETNNLIKGFKIINCNIIIK